jgi:hypothetical protein
MPAGEEERPRELCETRQLFFIVVSLSLLEMNLTEQDLTKQVSDSIEQRLSWFFTIPGFMDTFRRA